MIQEVGILTVIPFDVQCTLGHTSDLSPSTTTTTKRTSATNPGSKGTPEELTVRAHDMACTHLLHHGNPHGTVFRVRVPDRA